MRSNLSTPLSALLALTLALMVGASSAHALPELDRLRHPVQLGVVLGPLPGSAAAESSAPSGSTLLAAARLEHRAGWHTYWQNPGDSGLPTELRWTLRLADGQSIALQPDGPIQWPTPKRFPIGPLANYGYEGTAFLAQPLRLPPAALVPEGLRGASLLLEADWLVCEEVCIPGSGTAEIALDAHARAGNAGLTWMGPWRSSLPVVRDTGSSGWGARVDAAAGQLLVWGPPGTLDLPPEGRSPGLAMPIPGGIVSPSSGQTLSLRADGRGWVMALPLASGAMRARALAQWESQSPRHWPMVWVPAEGPAQAWTLPLRKAAPAVGETLRAIPAAQTAPPPLPPAALPRPWGGSWGPSQGSQANETDGPRASEVSAAQPSGDGRGLSRSGDPVEGAPLAAADLGLGLAMALALVGGLLLNLMPCVFPILGLKVLSLVGQNPASTTAAQLGPRGLAFFMGTQLSLLSLAALLLALRAAGSEVGWGFQLQNPAVLVGLAALFFLIALNLLGAVEVRWSGGRLAQWAQGLGGSSSLASAFGTGVLTVVVATPCTAPFMGAALGYGLTQPAGITLLVFAALGLGLALPTLVLMSSPALRRRLPRPGPWMETLRRAMAFPMLASVLWLLWVLSRQANADLAFLAMAALLALALGVWLWPAAGSAGGLGRRLMAATVLLIGVAAAVVAGSFAQRVAQVAQRPADAADPQWLSWQPGLVDQKLAEGKVVFLDVTADWCVVCKANKLTVLEADEVRKALAQPHVVAVRADWTRADPEVTRLIEGFGRPGVPLNVIYRPGETPVLLPEILSRRRVLDGLR